MSEWIKCSDLMPDDEVYVLFYQKYHKHIQDSETDVGL